MKKFLSLVLALVMTMSLVTISAGAKDFTDDSKITYAEAVDVISAVKVVDGYTDGSFNPTATLTRGAAAKIICNLILGPTTASALVADAAPYKDVPADSTFAGYIAFCAKEGIIDGYTDGTFRPGNTLTGYAFMKLLLGALGYDKDVEGYNGANWSINVAKRALNIGLDDGLVDDFNGVKPVTREEAALYAFNTLKATMVQYDSKTTVSVGGAEVVIAGSKAQDVEYKNGKYDGNIADDDLLQFAEKYFTKLKGEETRDDFGRPATQWKNSTSKIGTYVWVADAEYTEKVELGDIYADLGLSKNEKTDEYAVNGKAATAVTVAKKDEDKIGEGKGTLTQVWWDDEAERLIITSIETFVGKVASVTKASGAQDRFVTIAKATAVPGTLNTKFETESFAKDDIIIYTAAWNKTNNRYDIKTVELLEKSATGTLTEWNGSSANLGNDDKAGAENDFTVDGETYEYSKNVYVVDENGFGSKTDISAFDVDKSELNVYLDKYGYAIYVTGVEGETNYAAVIGVGNSNQYGSEVHGVTLLLADGTQKTVTAKADDWDDFTGVTASPFASTNLVTEGTADLVTYTVDEDGIYKLTLVDSTPAQYDNTYDDVADEIQFVNGKSAFVLDDNANATGKDKTLYATSDTIFMVCTNNGATKKNYNVYVGYENMPSIDSTVVSNGVAYICNKNYPTQIDVVYLDVPSLAGISSVDTYIAKKSGADIITNSKGDYYVLPAIVDGAETTVMISADFVYPDLDGDTNPDPVFTDKNGNATAKFEEAVGVYALNNVVKNSKDIVTSFKMDNANVFNANAVPGTPDKGTVAANKVVLGIGGQGNKNNAVYWAYNDKTNVYVVDKDYKTITVSSVADVDTDANDLVYASHDNSTAQKKLVDVVIVKQDDKTLSNDARLIGFKSKNVAATASTETGVDFEVVLPYAAAISTVASTYVENFTYVTASDDVDSVTAYWGATLAAAQANTATLINNADACTDMYTGWLSGGAKYMRIEVVAEDQVTPDTYYVKLSVEAAPTLVTTATTATKVKTQASLTSPTSGVFEVKNAYKTAKVGELKGSLSAGTGFTVSFIKDGVLGGTVAAVDTDVLDTSTTTGLKIVVTNDVTGTQFTYAVSNVANFT